MADPIYTPDGNERYTVQGRHVISNTEVLSQNGLCDYSMVAPEIRERSLKLGRDVHLATALLDRKKDWRRFGRTQLGCGYVRSKIYAFPIAVIEPYVMSWKACKRELKFHPELIEEPLHDPVYDCCTTPDSFGTSRYGWTTIQKKTGPVEPFVALQTAFEERAIAVSGKYATKDWSKRVSQSLLSSPNRFGVELRADGSYKLTRFDDLGFEQDIRVFLGFLITGGWKVRHGYRTR